MKFNFKFQLTFLGSAIFIISITIIPLQVYTKNKTIVNTVNVQL